MVKDYFKSKYKTLLAFIFLMLVFMLVSYLYSLPTGAYIYTVVLCTFFAIVFFGWGYFRFSQRYLELKELEHSIEYKIDNMPATDDRIEEEYQKMLKTLFQMRAEAVSKRDGDIQDMVDYYTLWVHQIKNPIFAMRLVMDNQDFKGKDELQMELFKIEQYVEMVLQYLRLGSDYTDFQFASYELDGIIKQAVKKYSMMFIKKKITLEYEPTGVQTVTDDKWLTFVLEQLISNALKYTQHGKVAIYIENAADAAVGNVPESGGSQGALGTSKVIVIQDTGIGIQAEDLPRVCDRGYTGYNGRIDKKSTGIGLYLCKEILNKLGHSLSIESELGVGTKVKITVSDKNVSFE